MFKHPMTSYSSGMISMFFLLSVLFVCCRGGTFAAADVEPRNSSGVELFNAKKTQLSSGEGSSRTGPPNSFYEHSLLDVNGMMVALAMADFTNFHADGTVEIKRDIWAKHIKYGGDERTLSEITKKENEGKWKTQVAVSKGSGEDQYNNLFGPRAVAKGNKIHFLLTNMTRRFIATGKQAFDIFLDLEWVVGEVASATGEGQQKITWKPPTPLRESFKTHMTANNWTNLLSGGGRGVVAGGSTIVFPLQATTADYPIQKSAKKGYICSAIYKENDGETWSLPSNPVIAEGCKYSTLLEWEGKLLMVTVSVLGARNVYESTDNGRTWNKATGPIAHLLSDSDAGPRISSTNDLITATIANRSVILFTKMPSGGGRKECLGSAINIWLSDGTRMHNAGPISTGTVPNFYPFSALLHTNNELFALYERVAEGDGSSESVVFTHLTEQLERITSVLKTWKEVDERVSSSCMSTATRKDACITPPMPTTGLIGFLSNTSDGAHWADEYLGVNVIVDRDYDAPAAAKKVENGFTFSGSAGKIGWPVGEQPQQAYSFVNDGLTLVATVSINKAPAKVTPLVGVVVEMASESGSESDVYLGLWYDESKRWRTELTNPVTAETIKWEEGQTYQVALTIQNGTGSAYVDGKRVGSLGDNTANNVTDQGGESSERDEEEEVEEELGGRPPRNKILYVLFWDLNKADNEEGTEIQVTVKNVFLYNHAYNNSEMEALIPMDEKSTVQKPQHPQYQQKTQEPAKPTRPTKPTKPKPTKPKSTKKTKPTRTTRPIRISKAHKTNKTHETYKIHKNSKAYKIL